MTQRPLIEIKDLQKVFHTLEGEVRALDGVSLSVNKGEIYGVIGLSGAGKSTLIRCINRLDAPSGGDILFDGESVLTMDGQALSRARRRMGMIFQSFNLLMQKTVARNVRYPLEIAGVPSKKADERVRELLAIVGLSDKSRAYPSQLSGGQRQRVAIARALACDPEVLLCDEATSALDPMTTQSILALLQDINRRMGITILIITHEMAVIRQICTRVAIIEGGKIAEEGTVDDVFLHTRSQAGRRLFGVLPEQEEKEEIPCPALRIVFGGAAAGQPIIAGLVRDCGASVNILSANMRRIGGKTYGQMLIESPGGEEERDRIIQYLTDKGLTVNKIEKGGA